MFNKMRIWLTTLNGELIVFLFQLYSPVCFPEIVRIAELSDRFDQNYIQNILGVWEERRRTGKQRSTLRT